MEIIPAILPQDFAEVEDKIALIVGVADTVQIDICDGRFVPSITWPYRKHDENFEAILREEKGMPEWERINYEFDLMISEPNEDDARKWLSVGAERIILHADSSADLMPVMNILHGLVEIGLALSSKTSPDIISTYKEKISYVQFMGIDKVGFQGQKFNADVLEKIKKTKALFPELPLQVDGGVSLENAALLKHAGVDRLVVGSALFGSDNIIHTLEKLRQVK